ncbi:hypothetical protein EAG_01539 [Camponotus floridanus]|uniref:Uncharacterized protein n=1 Tax=Camponotus floridanus TaxID=104421 RepID=E2AVS7_CAMFO|nr:hypothetical protein EAG_01539 [Camponotus floridanus]
MSMMKNRDVLSFGFDEYLVVPMELTSESRKNERNESCNKRLVEFDEWQDETDAMLCGDENERNMVGVHCEVVWGEARRRRTPDFQPLLLQLEVFKVAEGIL